MKKSKIGLKVRTKKAMLGNPVGAIGYVINEYTDFDDRDLKGLQIIFENGSYDDFSVKEQVAYLDFLEIDSRYSKYEFKNVMQVWRDYTDGYWRFE